MSSNTYLKLCSDYYNLTKPYAPEDELTLYLQYAEKAQGAILEPMCGTGRFLIPMLKRGFAVEGFDSSQHMLDILLQKCTQKNLVPAIKQCFLQDFKSDKHYDLIFIPAGSFGLITDYEQVKKCLHILYDHLAPGGKLVFEVDTPASLDGYPLGIWHQSQQKKDDASSIIFHQLALYNKESQIYTAVCRYEYRENDQLRASETEIYQIKLYNDNELDLLLQHIGFKVITYTNHKKDAELDNATIRIYECTKGSR